MSFHCKACRIAVPHDGKGACSICGGAVVRIVHTIVHTKATKPCVTVSKAGSSWKAKFIDSDGIVRVAHGTSQAEAVFALLVSVIPQAVTPIEIHFAPGDADE